MGEGEFADDKPLLLETVSTSSQSTGDSKALL
jgi:hypothetical protein